MEHETLISLAVAAAAGFLIGLERERTGGADGDRSEFAGGARTHPLVALAGALSTIVAREVGAVAVAGSFAALVVLLAAGYVRDLARGGQRGITSEVAFVVSFLLGAAAAASQALRPPGERFLAVAATAVVVTTLLSAKPLLHPFARRLSQADLLAALKLLVIAVVVLPLLPNEDMGPLRAVNPFKTGMIVVLIAGVDFVAYAAVRLLGPERGLGLTGMVGGIASSTAVTLAMASRAKQTPELAGDCVVATVLAGGIMFVRAAALVAVVAPGLLPVVAPILGTGAATVLAVSAVLHARTRRGGDHRGVEISNPFQLSSALKFGLVLTVVLVGSKAAARYLGTAGAYVAAIVAGVADVDAIILSMADLARGGLAQRVAAIAMLLAIASNTLSKAVMALFVGGWRFGRQVAAVFAAALAAGLLAAVIVLRG